MGWKSAALGITLAILFHQSQLRGRAPVEALAEFDTLSDCYTAWDAQIDALKKYTWCDEDGDIGGIGTGADGSVDPLNPPQ